MHRDLYLVAYDIREPNRLRDVHKFVIGYATGGQYSAYECFLTEAEHRELAAGLAERMELEQDRAHVIRLRTNCVVTTLGVAVPPRDPTFYFVGG
jgi:CRISPR-associated protein Cas2